MMRLNILHSAFISFIVFYFIFQGNGQGIHYTCYKKSECVNKPIQIKKYTLSNSDTTFISNDSGVCYVTFLGNYTFYSAEITSGVESYKIEFTFLGKVVDTIRSWALYPVFIVDGQGSDLKTGDWVFCGSKSNGYLIDYHHNGQKRIEGLFKNGKPIGDLKFYDELGKLKYVEVYSDEGKKKKGNHLKH